MGKIIVLISFAMLISFNLYSFETIMRMRKDIALILRRLPGEIVKKQDAKNEEERGGEGGGAKPMIVKGMTDIFKKVVQQVQ
jgi:hypothetical protein